MTLQETIQAFEDAKERINPVLDRNQSVIPIIKLVESGNGNLEGDGFSYGSDNRLYIKNSTSGYSLIANPTGIINGYRTFGIEFDDVEDMLLDATSKINEWYSILNK